jgi:glycosyltransferase involved in cell wall biosynthesis
VSALPLISVVIPCFKHGHYLREAVASTTTSTHPTEVVIVDDGSPDETPEIASALLDTAGVAVRYFRQSNEGLARARNRGLFEARGDYVVFLDADDRLTPTGLDVGVAALAAHPESAFVFGRCLMMDAAGTVLPTPGQPRLVKDHYRELLRRNFIWMPATVMFRRDAVARAGGFNSSIDATADYDLYLHIARHYPVHDHGQVVAHYRRHEANMSGDASRMLRETLAVLRVQRPFLEGDAASLEAYREGLQVWQDFYGTHLVNEIRAHVAAGEWPRAIRKAITLGHYHPRGLAHHIRQKVRVSLRLKPQPIA